MAIPHFQRQRGAVWKHVFEEWPRKRSGSDWPQVQLGTLAMSALGHVWTAPWQELSDAAGAFVGCDHVSGLFVRLVRPLALMLCADRPCLHYVVVSSPILSKPQTPSRCLASPPCRSRLM